MAEFTYRSARSGGVTAAISAVVLIETVAFHFLISARHPAIAWPLTIVSLSAVVWIVVDYRAMGRGAIRVDEHTLYLTIGRRFDVALPLASVDRAFSPSFRDLPTPGTNQGRDYVNVTKPAKPNVLVVLREPRRMRIAMGIHRVVQRVAIHVDDPAALLRALDERRASDAARTA